jgi:hypothetical protein
MARWPGRLNGVSWGSLVLRRLLSQNTLHGGVLQQPLEHSTRASMLKTFVRGQTILGPITATAELAHIQRVWTFMFILEVTLKGVITREGAATVWTFLRFIYTTTGWRRDSVVHASTCKQGEKLHCTTLAKTCPSITEPNYIFILNTQKQNQSMCIIQTSFNPLKPSGNFTYHQV